MIAHQGESRWLRSQGFTVGLSGATQEPSMQNYGRYQVGAAELASEGHTGSWWHACMKRMGNLRREGGIHDGAVHQTLQPLRFLSGCFGSCTVRRIAA